MRGKATLDQGERTKIYSEIQEIIAEEAPIIYLYYPQEIRVFNDKVQGFAQWDIEMLWFGLRISGRVSRPKAVSQGRSSDRQRTLMS